MTDPPEQRHQLPLEVEGIGGRPLRLSRAWPRSTTHALVEVTSPEGGSVAGQWYADDGDRQRLQRALPGAVARGPVVLQPDGLDHRLPALAPLLRRPENALLVHRPGRRAVIRRTRTATTYLKLVRPGRVADTAAAMAPPAGCAKEIVRFAPLIEVDEDLGLIESAELAGQSLHELPVDKSWVPTWTATGRALTALHDSAPVAAQHSARDEARTTRQWLDLAVAYGLLYIGPDTAAAIDEILHELEGGPPGPMGVLHRDLHDKQVLVSDDAPPGLIDLDTLAVGERALDLANLVAHLELRVLQGHRSREEARAAAEEFLAGADPPPATLARLPVHLSATRLRLAAVYAFRPCWQHVAHQLLLDASTPWRTPRSASAGPGAQVRSLRPS